MGDIVPALLAPRVTGDPFGDDPERWPAAAAYFSTSAQIRNVNTLLMVARSGKVRWSGGCAPGEVLEDWNALCCFFPFLYRCCLPRFRLCFLADPGAFGWDVVGGAGGAVVVDWEEGI